LYISAWVFNSFFFIFEKKRKIKDDKKLSLFRNNLHMVKYDNNIMFY
jgi:hypothetical protein